MHPKPEIAYRGSDWTLWPDDDPLKPYVAAAWQTLDDLKRPVGIRDLSIDPWGCVEDDADDGRRGVAPAAAAGFPSGSLGNAEPKLMASLHAAILALGDGDPVAGMTAALERLGRPA